MSERIKFVVWRDRWLRGDSQKATLLSDDGCMCCLGFLAKALGATDTLIEHRGTPEEAGSIPWPDSLVEQTEDGRRDTTVCTSIIYANDGDDTDDDNERETQLRELFECAGIDVEFRDGAGP